MNRIGRVFVIAVVSSILMFLSGCRVVDEGTVGVSKRFGEIDEKSLPAGPYLNIAILREVEVWNIKTQRLNTRIEIPSSEGLIVGLETALLFKPVDVVALRTSVGVSYINTVLEAELINTFREVIGNERIESVIKNQEKLTAQIMTIMKAKMDKRGIDVEQLLVTNLRLPQNFKEAIERKLESEQKALQKEFELRQATKDAEIEVARARGAAEAQKIVRSTLSAEYLQYLWISTLNENPNVIYVATEANMPVFRTTNSAPVAGK